jgi:hypothetical protein
LIHLPEFDIGHFRTLPLILMIRIGADRDLVIRLAISVRISLQSIVVLQSLRADPAYLRAVQKGSALQSPDRRLLVAFWVGDPPTPRSTTGHLDHEISPKP